MSRAREAIHRVHARSTAILLLVAVLVAAGSFVALRLPAAIFPSVTFPIVKLIADAGDAPTARMIPTVTRPLEEGATRVPGIQRVLSTTSRGSTEISAQFAWGTDMQVALQRVQAEAARVRPDLPPDTRVDVEWMNTSIFPILGYALTSDTASQAELRQLAEYTLKPELIRIPGVSQVEIQGGREREMQIHLDPDKLAGHHLVPGAVIDALRQDDVELTGGLVERNHELYLAVVSGRADSLQSLGALTVPAPGGTGGVPIRLDALGTIESADAVSYVRTTADGKEAVLVNIIQQPSANTVSIARGIDRLLQKRGDLIPKGVHWSPFYDQARFITASVHGARDAIVIGVALAALVLLVFLRAWRMTLVAILTVPLTVALVLLGFEVSGQTINLMTLGGIAAAIGLVIDDAIVVVENIHRHRQAARSAAIGRRAAHAPEITGIADLLPALLGSSLSTIVVFLPFALLPGVTGAFFKPLALTMVLALLASFLLSAFAVPVATRLLERRRGRTSGEPRGESEDDEAATEQVEAREPAAPADPDETQDAPAPAPWTVRWSRHAIGWWPVAALVLVGLGTAGYALVKALDTDFLPAMDEGSIILDYWTPPGTSLAETTGMLGEVERVIQSVPDVAGYSRRTGTQLGFFITEPNRGDYVIELEPRRQRRPVDEVIADLRSEIAAVEPAVETDFGQLLEDNIGDLTGGVPQPIEIKVFGEDQATLRRTAEKVASLAEGVPGVEDVFDGITISGPALRIVPKPAELSRRGLTTEDLHQDVQTALVGTVAGDLRIGERVYDVRVFTPGERDLSRLHLLGADGSSIPLTDVARVSTGAPEAEIDRDDLKTYLGVTARLSGRSLGGAVAEIKRRLGAELRLPAGMSLEYGGLYAQQQSSFKGLLGVLLAGLLLVAVVLLFEFADWRAPLLVALIALAVLPGVLGALLLTGMTLNISSFVGAIMMVGIVGENAVFVIHEARLQLRQSSREILDGHRRTGDDRTLVKERVRDAWATAARHRVRPVVMTILATASALAPLALALGEGAQLLQPLAIAVIGGFVLSGPLVLWVLPALYRLLDPVGRLAEGGGLD